MPTPHEHPRRTGLFAPVDFPEMFRLVAHAQDAIFRIVSLATVRARDETPNMRPLAVIILGHSEGRPTTAGDQKHPGLRLNDALLVPLMHARHFRGVR